MSWYLESGKDCDVVLSTRIRLKRNFNDIAFLPKISDKEREEVFNRIKRAIPKIKENFQIIKLTDLDSITIKELIEKNLITPEFADFYLIKDLNKKIALNNLSNKTNSMKALAISENEDICITLNHEEHMSIQGFSSGNEVQAIYNKINKIDDSICNLYDMAFDEQYGFLTSNIIDVGTAMKISAFVHMPAIVQSGGLNKILDLVEKFGMNIKKVAGLLGDSVYQISTRQTLGITEDDLIKSFDAVISNIVNQERALRKYNAENNIDFVDKIYRSLGLLTYAKKLDQQEGEELISNIKVGVDLGLIDSINDSQIRQYMLYNKNANLQKALKNTYSEKDLQIERAKFLQQL